MSFTLAEISFFLHRYFMENICSRILELDNGKCFMHDFGGPGAYVQFKEARDFRRKSQANAAADARTLFKREAEWWVVTTTK